MSETDDPKKRFAALIRENVRPKGHPDAPATITVHGDHNFIAGRDVRIVLQSPPASGPQGAESKSKTKRKSYREELEDMIQRRIWNLGLTPDQFFELLSQRLGKHFTGMKDINARDLDMAYEIAEKLKRPALDD